jgi:hypothetical protein
MISSKSGMVRGLVAGFSSLGLGGEGISLLELGRAAALPRPITGSASASRRCTNSSAAFKFPHVICFSSSSVLLSVIVCVLDANVVEILQAQANVASGVHSGEGPTSSNGDCILFFSIWNVVAVIFRLVSRCFSLFGYIGNLESMLFGNVKSRPFLLVRVVKWFDFFIRGYIFNPLQLPCAFCP